MKHPVVPMIITLFSSTLAIADDLPTSQALTIAKSQPSCIIEMHMAGHAHSMIQGGATLNQTIQVLADTQEKKAIIEKIYDKKEQFDNATAASEFGVKLCKQITASL